MDAIAIESKNQSSLNKNVKKIQKKLKRGVKQKKPTKNVIIRSERGVVYLGHIPHGFYEDGIKAYASQFGRVTRVRVARSKHTGSSKGYAFVEFSNPEVAKIFAETVDNYLMYNRILKCHYIAPEKRHPKMFRTTISAMRYPKQKNQEKDTEQKNADLDMKKAAEKLMKAKKRIAGIRSFFQLKGMPFDIAVNDPGNALTDAPKSEPVIVEIDESDDEIHFQTPPNATKIFKKSTKGKNTPQIEGKK